MELQSLAVVAAGRRVPPPTSARRRHEQRYAFHGAGEPNPASVKLCVCDSPLIEVEPEDGALVLACGRCGSVRAVLRSPDLIALKAMVKPPRPEVRIVERVVVTFDRESVANGLYDYGVPLVRIASALDATVEKVREWLGLPPAPPRPTKDRCIRGHPLNAQSRAGCSDER